MSQIGDAIRARRMASMAASRLAELTLLSPQYINDIELGRRLPPVTTVIAIANEFPDVELSSWLWLLLSDQWGQPIVDVMREYAVASADLTEADDVHCEGHSFQRRGSWEGDDWCAADSCTSRSRQQHHAQPEAATARDDDGGGVMVDSERLAKCVCGHIRSVHSRHPGDCTAVVVSAAGMRNWCHCRQFRMPAADEGA